MIRAELIFKLSLTVALSAIWGIYGTAQTPKDKIIQGKLTKDSPKDRLRKQSYAKVHTVELQAGKEYGIELTSDEFDTFLRVEDGKGKVLALNDDAGDKLNSRLLFIPERTAKYRLVATSFQPRQTGQYSLTLFQPQRVGKPKIIAGKLTKKDRADKGRFIKPYKLKLMPDRLYRIDLDSDKLNPLLAVFLNPKFGLVDNDSGKGNGARLLISVPKEQAYVALATSAKPGQTGAFRLRIQEYGTRKRSGQAPAKHRVVRLIRGMLTKNDVKDKVVTTSPHKVHKIKLRGGKFYQLDLVSDAFDPILRLETLAGRTLYVNDDGGERLNARLQIGVEKDGEYRVIVTAYAKGKGKITGAYFLTVLEFAAPAVKVKSELQLAERLSNKAAILLLRNPAAALPLAQRAVSICTQIVGKNDVRYADALNVLALVNYKLGRYDPALAHMLGAMDIRSAIVGEINVNYVSNLSTLALLYLDMGKYEDAFPAIQKAKIIAKRTCGEEHIIYFGILNTLAKCYSDTGQFDEALPFLVKFGEFVLKKYGKKHAAYAANLNNRAIIYQNGLGRYDKALPLFRQANLILLQAVGKEHHMYVENLHNVARLYQAMGLNEKALPIMLEARVLAGKVYDKSRPEFATISNSLAMLYADMRQFDKSLPLLLEAKEMLEPLGETNPRFARIVSDLAVQYWRMGRLDKALPLAKQNMEFTSKVFGPDNLEYVGSLNNLGSMYAANGRFAEARPLLLKATRILEKIGRKNGRLQMLVSKSLALAHWVRERPTEAISWFDKMLPAERKLRDLTHTALTHQQRIASINNGRIDLWGYLSVATGEKISAESTYMHVLHFKGSATARQAEERAALDAPDLRPLAAKIRALRGSLAKLYQTAPRTPERQKAWRVRFAQTEKSLEDAEGKLAEKSQAYRNYQHLRLAGAQEVAKCLNAGTAFVDFMFYAHSTPPKKFPGEWSYESRLLAFVFRAKGKPALLQLGSAESIAELVKEWREAVLARKSDKAIDDIGKKLRARVWAPLEKQLEGIGTVLIAPDGVLCQLPFAALPGGKKGTYLVEEKAIGYVNSGQHFLQVHTFPQDKKGQGLLAFGGLQYGKGKMKALPGAKLEAERIRKLYQQVFAKQARTQLFAGNAANKNVFGKQFLPGKIEKRWKYLHLATHGQFEPPKLLPAPRKLGEPISFAFSKERMTYTKHPMLRCSLAFAGANSEPEKGVLTGKEISGLDMRGVDLAVLSACETALGKVDTGEGVQGLQQAFHMAGCRTVVASLWSLDDAATAVLVEEFYKNLWRKKMPKLQALRQAQISLLRNPKLFRNRTLALHKQLRRPAGVGAVPEARAADRSHPAFWAGLVLSGDPGGE